MITTMIIISAISIILHIYAGYCITREIFLVNKGEALTENERKIHLSIMFYNLVGWIILSFWVLFLSGPEMGFYNLLIDKHGWVFLLMYAQIITSLTRYIRKRRNGKSLVLNYKSEIKRSMSFGFSKEDRFDKIVQEFIKRSKSMGVKVDYIDDFDDKVIEAFKKEPKGAVLDFGFNTYLEKYSNEKIHDYIYHNNGPLVFGLHIHEHFYEEITPLEKDLQLHTFVNNKMITIIVKVNQKYVIPKTVKHGVIFTEANSIRLKWN